MTDRLDGVTAGHKKNIFLDDIRATPPGFELSFHTGEELLSYLRANPGESYGIMSFDHDLGIGFLDGYDVVKEIIGDDRIHFDFERMQFHTDNFEGMRNMYHYMTNAVEHGAFPATGFIDPVKKIALSGSIMDGMFRVEGSAMKITGSGK